MDKLEVGMELMRCFPGSFINHNGEFIAHPHTNQYFILRNCESRLEVKCKVLEWLSRAAYKTTPYKSKAANERFHRFMLDGINQYLGTDFTHENMELIYTYLGNSCNHLLTIVFVDSGYNMDILRRRENESLDHDR